MPYIHSLPRFPTRLFRRSFVGGRCSSSVSCTPSGYSLPSATPVEPDHDLIEHAFTPPIPPPPTQTSHSSLSTFLEHARRISLSPRSTTYRGTHYEYTCLQTLRRLGLSLHRVGGKADSGIDLLGLWHLPTSRHPLRVIAQCKALKAKVGPNLIRELEGAFVGAPVGWRGKGVLGIMCSKREATKGVREAMSRSRWPLVWVGIESIETDHRSSQDELLTAKDASGDVSDAYTEGKGMVKQVLWNNRAKALGLEGIDVTTKYAGDELDKELVLMWKGEILKELEEDEGMNKGSGVG